MCPSWPPQHQQQMHRPTRVSTHVTCGGWQGKLAWRCTGRAACYAAGAGLSLESFAGRDAALAIILITPQSRVTTQACHGAPAGRATGLRSHDCCDLGPHACCCIIMNAAARRHGHCFHGPGVPAAQTSPRLAFPLVTANRTNFTAICCRVYKPTGAGTGRASASASSAQC